jgi:hypothetical protein
LNEKLKKKFDDRQKQKWKQKKQIGGKEEEI